MRPGDIIAERFEIERPVASGGMGQVYRARDRLSGACVAVKVLSFATAGGPARFAREAQALAALRHPGIVRYVAHGLTAADEPYLAMEWLSGETLLVRLAGQGLTPDETITLATRVAGALGAVHRRGLVHRDLKPANLLLSGDSVEGVKIIDFGIARLADGGQRLTVPGSTLGTPGYIAPEQIRGADGVDARADVFALGCVLFRCLTGRGAFTGDDQLSILLKVLLDEPPRIRELRPGLPRALDDLVSRMLAKSPDERPRDGDAVALELGALGELRSGVRSTIPPATPTELTTAERRVICLVLTRDSPGDMGATLSPGEDAAREEELREAAARHQGRIEILADRSLLVVLTSAGAATDLAARAARCALSIGVLIEGAPIAIVTGRAVLASHLPVGELIDRAVRLLAARPQPRFASIRLDEVTAGLLGAQFNVGADDGGALLWGERDALSEARTLLGIPTACVGREGELAILDDAFTRCVEDAVASVVLVTAPAGVGKSRLGHEFLRSLRGRAEPLEIWIGRGEPVSAGSPFSLLDQALRRAVGLLAGEPLRVRQEKLRARVARHLGSDASRVAEFLGELCGAPFSDEESVQLRAARRDPMLMGDQMRRAFEDFLRAECEAQPVLLVLEDLHWGDLPTVKFVDAALRNLKDQPLMILALARPEVHELFPKLWAGRGLSEVHLTPLNRKASERLARDVLGSAVSSEAIRGLVERADGNAFYLEELIRAAAAGNEATLPETILSMVQARLEGLDPEGRRVLRAASVFGRTFWRGGVSVLVGGALVDGWLTALADQEVISPVPGAKFPGELEFGFRHALMREAAYGMLTGVDRSVGHRLAGEWLEQAGEGDAMVLGEHFERGEQPERAAAWYRRAAEHAFEGNDLEATIARADRSMACGASGDELGELLLLQAKAHFWRGENHAATRCGLAAMRELRQGSARFCEAAAEVVRASARVGDIQHLLESSEALLGLPSNLGSSVAEAEGREEDASLAIALSTAAKMHLISGTEPALAEALLSRAEEVARKAGDEPAVIGQVQAALSKKALIEGDVIGYLERLEAARASFERAGDLREACVQALNVGYAYMQLGTYGQAERVLREALLEAERLSLSNARTTGKHNLGLALARQGKLEEARAVEEEAIALARTHANRRMESAARIYLAFILTLTGDHERAAAEARAVADDPTAVRSMRAYAQATLAEVHQAEGRPREALAAAQKAMAMLVSLGGIEEGESLIRLMYAEALDAALERDAARAALTEARDRLLARAARIADPELRQSFLERVPENARTLARARAWLDPELAG
jgi:eukaryotic-like serine/threonine-protein kinase